MRDELEQLIEAIALHMAHKAGESVGAGEPTVRQLVNKARTEHRGAGARRVAIRSKSSYSG